jgi:SHS2 domain-containing protein
MAYGWGEHVGELELRVQAGTEGEVFAEAGRAFGELIGGGEGAAEERAVTAEGGDRALLLAAFLDELVFLAETEGFVPSEVDRVELADGSVRALVRGGAGSPPHLVKAVTHHRLLFERAPDGWRANAVLDV